MLKKPSDDDPLDVAAVQAATRLRTEVVGRDRGETERGGGVFTDDERIVDGAGGDKRLADWERESIDDSGRTGGESSDDMVLGPVVEAYALVVADMDGDINACDIALLFVGEDGRELEV